MSDGPHLELGELHVASIADMGGTAVLTLKGTEGTARVDIPGDQAQAFVETAEEAVLVYEGYDPNDPVVLIERSWREDGPELRTDGGTSESDRSHLDRVWLLRLTDDPTPAIGLQMTPSDGAMLKKMEAMEGFSDFTAEIRFYDPNELRHLAEKLRDGAAWIERNQDTDEELRTDGGRDPPPVLVVCCGGLRQIAVDGMTECPECGTLHRVRHRERPGHGVATDGGPIGVPLAELDVSTECPECGEAVEIAMMQRFVETDGVIRVTELGYVCPACRHEWTEEAA